MIIFNSESIGQEAQQKIEGFHSVAKRNWQVAEVRKTKAVFVKYSLRQKFGYWLVRRGLDLAGHSLEG